MPTGETVGGCKVTASAEIRNGDGELLVTFNSEDAEGYWENEYQKERIIYCMKHRRDKIPMHLRTGEKPKRIVIETIILKIKNWR